MTTTIALLMRDGRLPLVDHVIFADTGWKPARVYAQVDRLAELFGELGIPLHRVPQGNLRADAINPEVQGDLFDLTEDGDPDGCSPYGCRSGQAACA